MKIKLKNKEIEFSSPVTTENSVFTRGRSTKTIINLPEEWEDLVDEKSITVHLTEIGANQNLVVKRVNIYEVHLQTNGLPVDCYYQVWAERKDVPKLKQSTNP